MRTARIKGTACIVASAFGFALMAVFVRLADDFGAALSPYQKGFFRNLVAFVIAVCFFLREDRSARAAVRLGVSGWGVLVLRAALGSAGIFLNFYAISNIPICDALMLNKLAPFFTVLFSWLFLAETIRLRQALVLVGALAGAALVVRPCGTSALAPALCGFLSGVCAGGAYACVRKLGVMKVDGNFIVLFFSAFSCVVAVPLMAAGFQPMTAAQVLVLIGAGAAAALGQFGITAAYRFAAPREIAVFDYTNVVFAALLGFAVFGQVPDLLSYCGFAVILLMALLNRL